MKLNPEIYMTTAKDSLCDVFVGAWITVIACFSFQQRKQKGVGQNSPVSVEYSSHVTCDGLISSKVRRLSSEGSPHSCGAVYGNCPLCNLSQSHK